MLFYISPNDLPYNIKIEGNEKHTYQYLNKNILKKNQGFMFTLGKMKKWGVPVVAQQQQTGLVSMRMQVQSLSSLSGLRIQPLHELWWLQTWLGSQVAVAVAQASSCSSDLTPSLGIYTCCRCGPKKTGQKTKRKRKRIGVSTVVQQDWHHLGSSGTQVQSLACYSGLKIWLKLQLWLGSGLWPRNSICCGAAKKRKGKKKRVEHQFYPKCHRS